MRKRHLEVLYNRYNRREFVHPDPLEFLYNYKDPQDVEIVGLITSSLAYGRVAQILKSVSSILNPMGESPHHFLTNSTPDSLVKTYKDFKHRFTTDEDITNLLTGIKSALKKHSSLNECFLTGYNKNDSTILPGLTNFVKSINIGAGIKESYLLPSPENDSACKRLNLYLRWMVRRDEVDPGCWSGVSGSKLIIPLDTHMFKIGKSFNFTKRKQANLKTAEEISSAFSNLCPEDPTKYDFALTRFGIREELALEQLSTIFSS